MKRALAVIIGIAFAAGIGGMAVAQEKKPETKMDKSTDMKKPDDMKKMKTKTASGTVKSVSGDSVVVAGRDKGKDAEWTFVVDAKTAVKKAGKPATAAELQAGDTVTVKYAEHDGKVMAHSISAKAGGMTKKAADRTPVTPEKK